MSSSKKPDHDCHFWIKGFYNTESDEFYFTFTINDKMVEPGLLDFFGEVKSQLERTRTLEETKELINEMLTHPNSTMKQLGKIVRMAADSVWADCFLQSSLEEENPD